MCFSFFIWNCRLQTWCVEAFSIITMAVCQACQTMKGEKTRITLKRYGKTFFLIVRWKRFFFMCTIVKKTNEKLVSTCFSDIWVPFDERYLAGNEQNHSESWSKRTNEKEKKNRMCQAKPRDSQGVKGYASVPNRRKTRRIGVPRDRCFGNPKPKC
jgi:hypothetical protein